MKPSEYLAYLHSRSRMGLVYRNHWLYPRIARYLPGCTLDVGCGIGDFLRFKPGSVGVDVDPTIVEFCRGQGLDAHLLKNDCLPFEDRRFDSATLDNVLEHVVEPGQQLAEIHRVLRPAGTLVVGVPGRRGYESDSDHKRFYDESDLKTTLHLSGFRCSRVLHMPIRLPWMTRHLRIEALYGVFKRA